VNVNDGRPRCNLSSLLLSILQSTHLSSISSIHPSIHHSFFLTALIFLPSLYPCIHLFLSSFYPSIHHSLPPRPNTLSSHNYLLLPCLVLPCLVSSNPPPSPSPPVATGDPPPRGAGAGAHGGRRPLQLPARPTSGRRRCLLLLFLLLLLWGWRISALAAVRAAGGPGETRVLSGTAE
jgi:hypothetical protein